MKGNVKKTFTCEWISIEPVEGQKTSVVNEEDMIAYKTLEEAFEFRANLLLQRTAWELAAKL